MNSTSQVVIVTGASQGIGAGLVDSFRADGIRVVALSRSISERDDPEFLAIAGNVADAETSRRVVEAAMERFGRVDTLVNNAGAFMAKPFLAYSADDLAGQLRTNMAGFFHMTQAVLGPMVAAGSGHVVNITSSLVAQPMRAVPAVLASLTKGGVEAATRSLAIELSGQGVRINAVSPGIIDTPMHDPASHGTLAALHPVGRMGRVADIVEAVRYLDRADFVTGEVLHVDGGQTAGHW